MRRSLLAAIAIAALTTVSAIAIAQTAQGTTPAASPSGTPPNPAPGATNPNAGNPAAAPGATTPTAPPTVTAPGTPTGNTPVPSSEGTAAPAPGAESGPSTAAAAPPASSGDAVDTTALEPKDVAFSFEGPFGTYDRAALQRGFQVYKEVCSACHSLNLVAFHNLSDAGGPGFTEAQVKAIAAGFQVPADPDDTGKTFNDSGERLTRPGIPADYFPWKFENEKAARAANAGALPPDLSVIVKAREGGAHYVYSILTGFGQKPPANETMADNMNYNPYFPGHQIAMPPPLSDGVVTYSDGTKATVDQMAHDVATFLSWTAEPKMEERKRIGFGVILFMLALSTVLYLAYHRTWHGKHDVDVA